MNHGREERFLSFLYIIVRFLGSNSESSDPTTGWNNNEIKVLLHGGSSEGPCSQLWDLQRCALRVCQAWFVRNKHLHCVMKSVAVCLILFIYSGTAAKELFVSIFRILRINWKWNLESLLNQQNTQSLGISVHFLTCSIAVGGYI